MATATSARQLLQALVGKEIRTVTGRRNVVLRVDGEQVIVGTARSPNGRPVPVRWVDEAVARLLADSEIEVSVASLGYRSAFVGAVLLQMPAASLIPSSPPRIRLVRR
jgi:hypothetical protein